MKKIALFVILALAIAGAAHAQTVLKIATLAPEGTAVVKSLREAGKQIEQQTEGRVKFKLYPGGVMGNDTVVLRKMQTRQLHGATFTAGGISKVYNNFQVLSLPMLFRNYAEVDAARAKLEPGLVQGLADKGYISMGILEAGFIYMMGDKALEGVEDLKGQKVWIPEGDPVGRTVFETAGVPPVPLALPDVLTGLQTGLIDTVCSSPVATIALQWFTKVTHLTETPLLFGYGTLAFSKQSWQRIPENDRAIVKELLTELTASTNVRVRKDNDSALVSLKNQGLTFVKIPPERIPQLQKIADEAIDKLLAKGMFDKALVEEMRATANAVRAQ
jgi:TRAP-type transport system periplasmic protein